MSEAVLPKADADDIETLNDSFQKNGFVIVEDVVSQSHIESVKYEISSVLTAEANRHLPEIIDENNGFDEFLEPLFDLDSEYRGEIYEVLQDMSSIHKLCNADKILEVIEQLGVDAPNIRNIGTRIDIPGEDEYLQPIHQDINGMKTESCVNCWIPLQSVRPENGALRIWQGSHELGPIRADEKELNEAGYETIPESLVENYTEHYCSIDAGSILFFHPYLAHGSSTNRSEHIRWTNIVRFDDATEMEWLRDGENPYETLRREDAN